MLPGPATWTRQTPNNSSLKQAQGPPTDSETRHNPTMILKNVHSFIRHTFIAHIPYEDSMLDFGGNTKMFTVYFSGLKEPSFCLLYKTYAL